MNRPNAVRCECCLSPIGAGGAATAQADSPAAAPGASPQPFSAPIEAPGQQPPFEPFIAPPIEPGHESLSALARQPLPIEPAIGGGSAKFIVAVMIIGVVGGAWLMRPGSGGESVFMRMWRSRQVGFRTGRVVRVKQRQVRMEEPEALSASVPASSSRPAAPPVTSVPPASVGAPRPPAPRPGPPAAAGTAAPAGAPRVSPAREQEADARFQAALRLLDRKLIRSARAALSELVLRYPETQTAGQARELLAQIPREEPAPAAPASRPSELAAVAAGRPVIQAPPQMAQTGPRRDDPIAEVLAGRQRPTAQRPVIPESLRQSQPGAAAAPASTGPDEVRVVSAAFEGNSLSVNVEYLLATAHTKPVFLGAWMRSEAVSGRLGYTATLMTVGRGSAKLVLSGIPPGISQLRLAFFEEKGLLFFTRDFDISK